MKMINPFSKKIKLRYRLLTSAGICIAGLLILLLIMLSIIFSDKQNFQMTAISGDDISVGTKIVNRVLSQALQSRDKKEIKSITLNEQEVNAIITLAGNSKNIADIYMGRTVDIVQRPWQATYRNGKFDILFCAMTKIWTPFGSKINIKATVIPYITPETERIEILSAVAGEFPLPRNKLEQLAKQQLEKIHKKKNYKQIRKVLVKTIINDDGTITIYYRPYRLRKLATKLIFR
jgi:hypothetical protein